MPLFFTVVRGTPRSGGPDDLLVPTIGNVSQFPLSIQVLPESDLMLSVRLVNASVLGSLRVTTGEDLDILLTETLVSTTSIRITEEGDVRITEEGDIRVTDGDWGSIIFAEAPPDEVIYTPALVNVSEVNGSADLEVALAPPDEYLYTPPVSTSSVASAGIIVQLDTIETSEDSDPIVGAVVVGHTVV